jgi:chromate transporter
MNTLFELAYAFLKVGFFGFGGGFAMIPLMQSEAVYQHAWLGPWQFGAAIALGQVTPGPVAISATFIGYKVAGLSGATLATLAIFTPSVLSMYLLDKFYLKVRGKEITHAIMHGILPVVAALILHAAISLGRPALHSWWQAVIVLIVAILAITRRVSYGLLVLGCTVIGACMALLNP